LSVVRGEHVRQPMCSSRERGSYQGHHESREAGLRFYHYSPIRLSAHKRVSRTHGHEISNCVSGGLPSGRYRQRSGPWVDKRLVSRFTKEISRLSACIANSLGKAAIRNGLGWSIMSSGSRSHRTLGLCEALGLHSARHSVQFVDFSQPGSWP